NKGKEGFADFVPEKFTSLRIINDKRKNAKGEPLAYDLMPMRSGNGRHFGGTKEECTQHDYWVTAANNKELKYYDLPTYVKDGAPVMNADVVIWHSTPMHHEPRGEDGKTVNGVFTGATPIGWSGFELRPRNLFDGTPFFDYSNNNKKKKKAD